MSPISKQFRNLLFRWLANSAGLWLAARFISDVDYGDSLTVLIIAGLVLSLVNAVIKPLVIILSLPALILSLGIFMVFINGLMVLLVSFFVDSFNVDGYLAAILAGLVIGLVNYMVSNLTQKD